MSEYTARINWQRNGAHFLDKRYSRAHAWTFDGGVTVPASSSPHIVRVPMSDPANVDPEEAFVAALSSCHMLFFLSISAGRRFVVDEYTDEPVGTMEQDDAGKWMMTKVLLRPHVSFSGERAPDQAELEELHHQAHAACFLANSVKTKIMIFPG